MLEFQLVENALEAIAIFGEVDRIRRSAEDRHAGVFQCMREFERRLAAELNDDAMQRAVLSLGIDDFENVFAGQRLKIKTIGRVVIRRDGFRIAIDHDGLIASVMQRETCMAAAIVKLDALADPVRSTAENDDFVLVRRRALVDHMACERRFIGRIHIRGRRREFGRTGVDAFEYGTHAERATLRFHGLFGPARQHGQPRIRKAHRLQASHAKCMRREAVRLDLAFHFNDAAHLGEKPRIDLARIKDFVIRPAESHRLRHLQQPIRRRCAEGGAYRILIVALADAVDFDFIKAGETCFEATQSFLQRLLKRAADRHDFADRLHRCRQCLARAGEFLESESRNFGDDIIDRRLE